MSWIGELILNLHNWWNVTSKIKSTLQKDPNPLHIGVLAAAAINYAVIIDTTQTHPGIVLTAIAARSRAKAEEQIAKYGIGSTCKAYGSYDELLADESIDAVYIPTPNGLHAEWAIKAMESGKHVLIEKPIASNADEVRQIYETSQRTGKIALEAFHWRFHPAAHRCKAIVESGEYGNVTKIGASLALCQGVIGKDDIRWDYELGGGTSMDLAYVFSACSYFASSDPTKCDVRVLQATPRLHEKDGRIDEAMNATFIIEEPGRPPVTCQIVADSMVPHLFGLIPKIWRMTSITTIQLEKAEVEFSNFVGPYMGHAITVRQKEGQGKVTGKKQIEKCYVDGPEWESRGQPWWTTYRYQLEAFVDMIRVKENRTEYRGPWVSLGESEQVMGLVDKVYDKAGLPKRGL